MNHYIQLEVSTITKKANIFCHIKTDLQQFPTTVHYEGASVAIQTFSSLNLYIHTFLLFQMNIYLERKKKNRRGQFLERTVVDVFCCQLVTFISRSGVSFILLQAGNQKIKLSEALCLLENKW